MKAKLIKTWNFNKISIEEGTEVNLIKGMEADADSVLNAPCGMCYLCELNRRMCYIPATYLTITDWTNIDWEQRRYEIAKEAISAIMSNEEFYNQVLYEGAQLNGSRIIPANISHAAVVFADALIAELKKGGQNG